MPLEDGLLTVLTDGHPICQISGEGSVRYRPENLIAETFECALQKATAIAEIVSEYREILGAAEGMKEDKAS